MVERASEGGWGGDPTSAWLAMQGQRNQVHMHRAMLLTVLTHTGQLALAPIGPYKSVPRHGQRHVTHARPAYAAICHGRAGLGCSLWAGLGSTREREDDLFNGRSRSRKSRSYQLFSLPLGRGAQGQ